eukprot:6318876-Alexandrium_andersonii.AAC.1
MCASAPQARFERGRPRASFCLFLVLFRLTSIASEGPPRLTTINSAHVQRRIFDVSVLFSSHSESLR